MSVNILYYSVICCLDSILILLNMELADRVTNTGSTRIIRVPAPCTLFVTLEASQSQDDLIKQIHAI